MAAAKNDKIYLTGWSSPGSCVYGKPNDDGSPSYTDPVSLEAARRCQREILDGNVGTKSKVYIYRLTVISAKAPKKKKCVKFEGHPLRKPLVEAAAGLRHAIDEIGLCRCRGDFVCSPHAALKIVDAALAG